MVGTVRLANLLSLKYDFWWHHLKGIFLSFQKILKFLTLDLQNLSYSSWKKLIEQRGWGCSWTSFNSHNFSIVDPMSTFLWFSKSLGNTFQMMYFNPKFHRGPNLSFFGLGPWAIIHGTVKLANTFISQIWFLMTPFERYFSKLSENPKIFYFGST